MCVRRGEIGAARWFVIHFINDCFKNVRTPFLPISIATVYVLNKLYSKSSAFSRINSAEVFFKFFNKKKRVGVNCSKFDCSTINWLTLLAGNQLLDTKIINCSNPVNPGLTGFEQLTIKVTNGIHCRAVDISF